VVLAFREESVLKAAEHASGLDGERCGGKQQNFDSA
jgi:hypothetical protein